MTAFYRLLDDVASPWRWHLGETRSPDGNEKWLDGGEPCEEDELVVEVTHPGVVLDFSLTSFNAPIATRALALAIASIAGADVQQLRASIAGQVSFDLLNAVRVVSCLDERESEFIKRKAGDHRPDLIGQYRQVTRLVLDRSLCSLLHSALNSTLVGQTGGFSPPLAPPGNLEGR